MEISRRIRVIVDREFADPRRGQVLDLLSGLGGDGFDKQDPDRMAAAVLIIAIDEDDLRIAEEAARGDFRDLLMDAGLANESWRDVLDARFGPA